METAQVEDANKILKPRGLYSACPHPASSDIGLDHLFVLVPLNSLVVFILEARFPQIAYNTSL
jgi:hypothetical protein